MTSIIKESNAILFCEVNRRENMEKPSITYPCTWSYRLIGEDSELIIKEIPPKMGSIKHEISEANRSKQGKYVSINIDAIVSDDNERLSVVLLLQSIPTVKMVI
jgi:uncharacterized protein